MGNSSDEELSSDNEQIDLRPLWRDRPFLSDSASDEEPAATTSEVEDLGSPRIELTPCTSSESRDEIGPLETLMAEIREINSRVTPARSTRQQLLDQGFLTHNLQDHSTPSNNSTPQSTWTRVGPNRYSLTYGDETPASGIPSPPPMPFTEERVPRRITQLRTTGTGNSPPPPKWVPRWKQQQLLQMAGAAPETVPLPDDTTNQFILPAALEEKEKEDDIDEDTRAERSEFISQLIYSTLMEGRRSRIDEQQAPSSSKKTKKNRKIKNSKK